MTKHAYCGDERHAPIKNSFRNSVEIVAINSALLLAMPLDYHTCSVSFHRQVKQLGLIANEVSDSYYETVLSNCNDWFLKRYILAC